MDETKQAFTKIQTVLSKLTDALKALQSKDGSLSDDLETMSSADGASHTLILCYSLFSMYYGKQLTRTSESSWAEC
jgi:rhamnogalacturonyl hydrolase YesR